MSELGRLRRPIPARTKPNRTWDGFLGTAPAGDGRSEAPPRQVDDVIARSVELGYRVVDEYVTRGQEAAQRVRRGTYGASEAAQDVQSVAEQLVRTASDFAGAWVEFFALAGRDARPNTAAAPAAAPTGANAAPVVRADSGGDDPPPPALRVCLRVDTLRPVEAMLEMSSVPATHGLVAHRLRLASGEARIDEVRVEPGSDGSVVIRVTVPEHQAAGRYVGIVVDDTTNVTVGEVTIGIG
jgi:hypothetical protein